MNPKVNFHQTITGGYRILRERRSLEAWTLGASLALPLLVFGLAVGTVLRFHAVTGWLVPLFAVAGVVWGALTGARFLRRHGLSLPEFLRLLERRSGLRENELVNAEDLERALPAMLDPLSRALAEQTITRGVDTLRAVPVRELAPAMPLKTPLFRIGGAAAAALLLLFVSPDAFRSSAARLVHPGMRELPPALVVRVQPGDATIVRGSSVEIQAEVPAGTTDAHLLFRAPGGNWETLPMRAEGAAGFRTTLAEISEATDYAVQAGAAKSEIYRLSVSDPLRVAGFLKRVEPPAYTKLPPTQELSADGHLSAIAGSRISVGIQPNHRGAEGRLLFTDGPSIALESVTDEQLAASFPLRATAEYRVRLTSPDLPGIEWTSEPYRVEAVPDRVPTLYQLAPERSISVPTDMRVDLEADCLDDFGLTRLDLVFQRGERSPERTQLMRWQGEREARVSWSWDLEGVLLTPGDVVRYHLELTDNDGFSGPKTTLGPECEIRFPTLEEMYRDVAEDREDQVDEAKDLVEAQKQLRSEMEKARQELQSSRKLDWADQEQLKSLAKQQEKISDQIEDLAKSLDQSLDQMQQSAGFTPEMLQKVQEISELVKQIESPSFKQQVDELRRAMEKLDRQAIDKALEKLQASQEDLEQSLDRTLELLKKMLAEEKFEETARAAEQLAEEQRELNEEMSGKPEPKAGEEPKDGETPGSEEQKSGEPKDSEGKEQAQQSPMSKEESAELAAKQAELQKKLDELKKQMEEMKKEAEQRLGQLNQEMEERKPEDQLSSAKKNMQGAQQSMGSCQKKDSLKFGRQAQKDLEQMAKSMREAQQAAKEGENEEITKRLFALSGQLVQLSQTQESVLDQSSARSTRELAEEQVRLAAGAKRTLDELYELGKMTRLLSPELGRTMGEAVRTLDGSTDAFEQGDRGQGVDNGRQSSVAMDKTVLELLNANNKMCNSSSCSSSGSCSNPQASLRGLSGQQESLNDQAQSMMGQSGQRLSPQGGSGDQLAQMAARQQMIKQGLEEVQKSLGDRSDVLGRLGDLGKEMEDIAEDLRENGLDERILERQQKILSRLLTAQKSLRKEDYKDERTSRTGDNSGPRESPLDPKLDLSRAEALRRGILRGEQDPVPSDYKRLVEEYFRSLSEQP